MTITEERLNQLPTIHLDAGHHNQGEEMCLLEAAAWVAGEPWTDHPQCVCPILATIGRNWNDALNDTDRDRILKPFIPQLIGTRATPAIETARSYLALDWTIRTSTPTWLHLAGLHDEATALEQLTPITSPATCTAAMTALRQAAKSADAARAAVWAAAGDAVWAAAGAAVWAAAGAAVWDAAGDAARAAAGAAVWAAAGAAAGAAVWAAAGAGLAPTVAVLQTSAADLYTRMINLTSVA